MPPGLMCMLSTDCSVVSLSLLAMMGLLVRGWTMRLEFQLLVSVRSFILICDSLRVSPNNNCWEDEGGVGVGWCCV